MTTFNISTLGCKVNTYDTSLLEKQLLNNGFLQDVELKAKVHIINSCAVTEKSSLETHKVVKKIKSKNPQTVVVVTGCVAQVDVNRLKTLTGADLIIGNSHKENFHKIVLDYIDGKNSERIYHSNIFHKMELSEGGGIESSHTRSFLKIQDGCNQFCTFCIIPFARGKSRSLPVKHLITRVNELHLKGFQEVVLTGVHCGDYDDEGVNFSNLVEKILNSTTIPRVRLSSLEPIEVDEKLWQLFKENPRLCKHIHVSLQSANSKVLKDMKRKYGQGEIKEFFKKFQTFMPSGFIGMDVIVGFPGETEEEFMDTYEFLAQVDLSKIHVFPYSIRPGTLAAKRSDHLKENIIQSRAKKLRSLSRQKNFEAAQRQIGQIKNILVLDKPSYGAQALSSDYWPVRFQKGTDYLKGNGLPFEVQITGLNVSQSGDYLLEGAL
ncbi:MAG: tRNA (N(6)-L-threonylcarbamoyladenosine(37)-C(2))-methylthiotransferase MtaB [Oligoflexia bacterium]|nr:tRNA (N(6)-L-threonylcarbamoyladenosine(37)-C(2))-methylthiotransferase MtaB [Oligoflexia bacterium]